MPGPLDGLRVVDLTQVLSGPYASMLLADLGADVVKVEPPAGDASRAWGPPVPGAAAGPGSYGGYFASINRNKRSVCLDLKTPEGRAALLDVLAGADVLLENFLAGVMERLGLSYETLHDRFPRLVYATIRGFGDPRTGESPYAHWPAFDIIAQAMGGLVGVTGPDAAHPMKVGPGVGDIFPAALVALGIVAAVRHADATGEGQLVDVAMYDAVLALCERIVYQHSLTGVSPGPPGNLHPLLCPYGLFATSDGWVAIAAPADEHWSVLAATIGSPELATDPVYATNQARVAHGADVHELLARWTAGRTTAEAMGALAGRVPIGPVNTAADIAVDPHVAARQMVVELTHPLGGAPIRVAGTPIKFSATTGDGFRPAPLLGEHNEQLPGHDDDPHQAPGLWRPRANDPER